MTPPSSRAGILEIGILGQQATASVRQTLESQGAQVYRGPRSDTTIVLRYVPSCIISVGLQVTLAEAVGSLRGGAELARGEQGRASPLAHELWASRFVICLAYLCPAFLTWLSARPTSHAFASPVPPTCLTGDQESPGSPQQVAFGSSPGGAMAGATAPAVFLRGSRFASEHGSSR
jgi:hypothetical protein